jgi:hypothetical protein
VTPESATVKITDRARAVLALDDELSIVLNAIESELRRHTVALGSLTAKRVTLEASIQKLGEL